MPSVTASYDAGYRSDGTVWVANDASDSPIKAFNTSGVLVQYIPGDLVGNAARGVDFDPDGYLWCSNPNTDKLYKISLTTGIGDQPGVTIQPALGCSSNPFQSYTVVQGSGFSAEARIEVFDMSGREVLEAPFGGSFTVGGQAMPAGTYVVRVVDGTTAQGLRLVKL